MWLLNTSSFELVYFNDPIDVPFPGFAILSHVWDEKEQTWQDLRALFKRFQRTGEHPRSWVCEKIRKCCELAEADGYKWVWIDTCCIDKSSSAELSEAINSMYRYYSLSGVCYAYLKDVSAASAFQNGALGEWRPFRWSVWHQRGWTLQELIAPTYLILLTSEWTALGSKADLSHELEEATRIPASLLCGETKAYHYSISQRMSWAAERRTTRIEDEAYSLFGLFDIKMSPLYGERENAFLRLQEAIMRQSSDTTLFAWGKTCSISSSRHHVRTASGLFTRSPNLFQQGDEVAYTPRHYLNESTAMITSARKTFTVTPHGVLARIPVAWCNDLLLADLSWSTCTSREIDANPQPIFLVLRSGVDDEEDMASPSSSGSPYYHVASCSSVSHERLFIGDMHRHVQSLQWAMMEVYVARYRMKPLYADPSVLRGDLKGLTHLRQHLSIHAPFEIRPYLRLCTVTAVTEVNISCSAIIRLEIGARTGLWSSFVVHLGACRRARPQWLTETGVSTHWARVDAIDTVLRPDSSGHICPGEHVAEWPGLSREFVFYDKIKKTTLLVRLSFKPSPLSSRMLILHEIATNSDRVLPDSQYVA